MNTTQQPQRMSTKKKAMIVTSIALIMAILFVASFAWMTTEQTKENEFNTKGGVNGDIELTERFDPEDGDKLYPGTEIDKLVGAVNKGKGKGYVRVRFEQVLTQYEANSTGDGLEIHTRTTPADAPVNPADPTEGTYIAVPTTLEAMQEEAALLGLTEIPQGDMPTGFVTDATHRVRVWASVTPKPSNGGTRYDAKFIACYQNGADVYQRIDISGNVYDANDPAFTADKSIPQNWLYGTPDQFLFYKRLPTVYGVAADQQVGYTTCQRPNVETSAPFTKNIGGVVNDELVALNYGSPVYDISTFGTNGYGPHWYRDTDGWYYWGQPLDSGEATAALLKSVKMNEAVSDEAAYTSYKINVRMQGIQPTWEAVNAIWNRELNAGGTITTPADPMNEPYPVGAPVFKQQEMTAEARTLMQGMEAQ